MKAKLCNRRGEMWWLLLIVIIIVLLIVAGFLSYRQTAVAREQVQAERTLRVQQEQRAEDAERRAREATKKETEPPEAIPETTKRKARARGERKRDFDGPR